MIYLEYSTKTPIAQITRKRTTSVNDLKKWAARLFSEVGITTSVLDAELLLATTLNLARIDIQIGSQRLVSDDDITKFYEFVARRLALEPIAYILGTKEFYGHDFHVSNACLIPRPDTEIVVEKALSLIDRHQLTTLIDVCTGSGAIAITLLKERSTLQGIATDISLQALELAQKNARSLMIHDRLEFLEGDLFASLPKKTKVDLIVTNPPYIASHVIEDLSPSVRDFEPRLALDGGDSGIEFYKRILHEGPRFLVDKGFLVMEIGFDQKEKIEGLIDEQWRIIEFFKDLAGHTRGIVLQKI